jgi:hypothetical protein
MTAAALESVCSALWCEMVLAVWEVPVDHPGLMCGWWRVQRDGIALRRWTNGDAVLLLPTFRGQAMLEISINPAGMVYLVDADQPRWMAGTQTARQPTYRKGPDPAAARRVRRMAPTVT